MIVREEQSVPLDHVRLMTMITKMTTAMTMRKKKRQKKTEEEERDKNNNKKKKQKFLRPFGATERPAAILSKGFVLWALQQPF